MRETYMGKIEVGQRVHCTLYGGKDGTVFAIHGTQSPTSCQSLGGGVGTMGGTARFDIVWDNGTVSRGLPESVVRGSVQWRVEDEVLGAAAIDAALQHAEQAEARKEAERQAEAERKAAERARLLAAYPQLQQAAGRDGLKVAAANIRRQLKATFPGTRFSVRLERFAGGDAIRIAWEDGPTGEQVKAIADRYQEGHFNGMEDIYEYHGAVWTALFGGAKYLSTAREHSDAAVAAAIEALWAEYRGYFERAGIAKPTVEDFRGGRLSQVRDPNLHPSYAQSVQGDLHRLLAERSWERPVRGAARPGGPRRSAPSGAQPDPAVLGRADGFEVREGTKPGFVEVKFAEKPDAATRQALKDARFRWSGANAVWYGREEALPAAFQPQQ